MTLDLKRGDQLLVNKADRVMTAIETYMSTEETECCRILPLYNTGDIQHTGDISKGPFGKTKNRWIPPNPSDM